MADFMQNTADPIEPVNFGIQDAVARAYQYLMDKEGLLKTPKQLYERIAAPVQAGAGAIGELAGRQADFLTNHALSVIDAKRANPDAFLTAAQDAAAPAYERLSQIGKGASSLGTDAAGTIENARKELIQKAGLIDTRSAAPTMTPAGQTRAPRPDAVAPNPGALPAAPRRVVAPRTPGGALPIEAAQTPETPGNADIYAPQAGGNTAEAGGGINALPPRAAEAPQKGFREQYMERLAGMAKPGAAPGLTEEQKGMALLEASLAGLAAASRPGASALGSIGQGGLQGTAVAREMQRINRERADKDRSEARADVRTEFDLAGKDADRADRKEEKAEGRTVRREDIARQSERDKATAAYQMKHLDILEEEMKIKGGEIKEGNGVFIKIGRDGVGKVVTDAGGKPISTKPKTEAEDAMVKRIKGIAQLTGRDVGAVADSVLGDKSAEAKGAVTEKDAFNKAMATVSEAAKSGVVQADNVEAFLDKTLQAVRKSAGLSNAPAPLPAGIPPGSKQVGTSKGNPVYQTPDGRKLVVTK